MTGEVFVNQDSVSNRWREQIDSLKADLKVAEARKSRPRIISLKEQIHRFESALSALETKGASYE